MNADIEQRSEGIIIPSDWLDMVCNILQQYLPDREVRAFGSRVYGGNRPFSDLDIAICGTEPLDDMAVFQVRDALEESDLPINVDVVPLQQAGQHIIDAVRHRSIMIQSGKTPTTRGI